MTNTDAAPKQAGERFALLDALRGAAALALMAVHLAFHSGAETREWWGSFTAHLSFGVTLFFVLSGFLLYRPHARAVLGHAARPDVASYAWKRVLRIVPAYWVALTVLALAGLAPSALTRDWWVYYGFLQSYSADWYWQGIGPAWSLSIEAAFYAALPLLGGLIWRLTRGASPRDQVRWQAAVILPLGLASFALRVFAFGTPLAALNQSIFLNFLWFSCGMLLAVAHACGEGRERAWRLEQFVVRYPGACWALAVAIYVAICLSPAFPRSFLPGYTRLSFAAEHVLFAFIALLFMLPAVFGEFSGGLPRRVLANPILTWAGRVSYGIFLWHEPIVIGLVGRGACTLVPGWPTLSLTLVALPFVLALAWLSFRFIETPALGLKNRRPFS